jgi:hypothetical protein
MTGRANGSEVKTGKIPLWGLPRLFVIVLVVAVAAILATPVFVGLSQGDVLGYLEITPPYQVIPCGFEQDMEYNGSATAQAVVLNSTVSSMNCPDQMPAGGRLTWTMDFTYPTAVTNVTRGEVYGCYDSSPMVMISTDPSFPFSFPLGGRVIETITFQAPASGGPGGLEVTCVTN